MFSKQEIKDRYKKGQNYFIPTFSMVILNKVIYNNTTIEIPADLLRRYYPHIFPFIRNSHANILSFISIMIVCTGSVLWLNKNN